MRTACSIIGSIAASPSRTPLVDPGRLMMSVRARTPASPRESAARGKVVSESNRMRSAIPGASRSSTARVASGVRSRGARPVPPVVSTRSATSPSHQATSCAAMAVTSSATRARAPAVECRPRLRGPGGDRIARAIARRFAKPSLAARAGVADREDRDSHPAICRVCITAANSALGPWLLLKGGHQRKPGTEALVRRGARLVLREAC